MLASDVSFSGDWVLVQDRRLLRLLHILLRPFEYPKLADPFVRDEIQTAEEQGTYKDKTLRDLRVGGITLTAEGQGEAAEWKARRVGR